MASIYLIRHGQASFGQQDYDALSDVGVTQSKTLGRALLNRGVRFDAVVSGTMQRHRQTLSACLGVGALADSAAAENNGWNEYDHEDILTGANDRFSSSKEIHEHVATLENPKKAFEQVFNEAVNRWMSGQHDQDYSETWSAYQRRIGVALQETVDWTQAGCKSVAVFTSGGVISVIAQSLLGVPSEKMMHMNWTLMNCAVTKLVSTRDRLFVASLNEHTHFESPESRHLMTYR